MRAIDNLLSIIAPHYCLECDREGALLCDSCMTSLLDVEDSRCALCDTATVYNKVCGKCRQTTSLQQVWTAGKYENILEQLITRLKFERTRSAASTLATILDYILPPLPDATIVAHIPTAPSRIRQRGYDQARLIAREFARRRQLKYLPLLVRNHYHRQMHVRRNERFWQARTAYRLRSPTVLSGPILLVDDVITTGATLTAAAKVCAEAGYQQIMAAAAAKRSPEK